MGVLTGLKPERVFYYFEELTKIPHGSYNCKAVSDYCVSVAKNLGLWVRQDETYNVIIKKPASKGYASQASLMIQGHLDMVCVKGADVDFDFEKDALNLVVEDGFVRAQGTTLGGDDGIAVAMGLAILEDDSIAHPNLEVVFTTEEEMGMDGALALDASDLKAKYLLNLDSEDETNFLAGCSGGCSVVATLPTERACVEGTRIDVRISGLVGGHSGAEIDICQASANILLGRLLFKLHQEQAFGIIEVCGGSKENAIAVESYVRLVADADDVAAILADIEAFKKVIATEFKTSDPNIRIESTVGLEENYRVFTMSLMEKLIFMLMHAPFGIQTMSADMAGLVESSLNLGILSTDDEGIKMQWSVRSSVKSRLQLLKDKLQYLTEFLGGEIHFSSGYPEWTYNPNSQICVLCKEVYEKLTGKPAVVTAIHAGLECGLFAEKMPGIDMVAMGPNIYDIHTSREKLEIASVERTYGFVLEVLKEFGNYCR